MSPLGRMRPRFVPPSFPLSRSRLQESPTGMARVPPSFGRREAGGGGGARRTPERIHGLRTVAAGAIDTRRREWSHPLDATVALQSRPPIIEGHIHQSTHMRPVRRVARPRPSPRANPPPARHRDSRRDAAEREAERNVPSHHPRPRIRAPLLAHFTRALTLSRSTRRPRRPPRAVVAPAVALARRRRRARTADSPVGWPCRDRHREFRRDCGLSQLHPDKNPSPTAVEEFERMRAAYDVLMDLELRGVYDKVRMTCCGVSGGLIYCGVFGGLMYVLASLGGLLT